MSARRFEIYAPVIIPTLCRFEHFKRCIDSLSKCTGAEYTDVYIGIDYPTKEEHLDGYRKICDYVQNVTGFNRVLVFLREYNYGPMKNSNDLRTQVKKEYDRFICSEDDNEFAPNFLEYINSGLERYKDNPYVLRICGCLMPWDTDVDELLKTYKYNAFPAKDFNSFGYGTWFSKYNSIPYTKESILQSYKLTMKTLRFGYWQAITRYLYQIHKESQLPDVSLRLYCAFHDKFCIFPRVSKVKNWGFDGTGINSDNNLHWLDVVSLDTASDFVIDEFEIKDYKEIRSFIGKMYGVHGFRNRIAVIGMYIFYRVTGCRLEDVPKGQRIKRFFSKRTN